MSTTSTPASKHRQVSNCWEVATEQGQGVTSPGISLYTVASHFRGWHKKILVLLANLVGADTLLPPAAALPRGLTASTSLTHTRQFEARPNTADT